MIDYLNSILYLHSDAKFSVWEIGPDLDLSHIENPVKLGNVYISWNPTNEYDCPSEESINSLDQKLVADWAKARYAALQKAYRDEESKKDLGLVAAYRAAKKSDSTLTFSIYLDQLESYSQDL